MSSPLPKAITQASEALSQLPGIGPKLAQRLAVYLATRNTSVLKQLQASLEGVVADVHSCSTCFMLTDSTDEQCAICTNTSRNSEQIMLVESVMDLIQIESSQKYTGYYFVLGSLLAPVRGVGPEQLHLDTLVQIIEERGSKEVIFALPATLEGESTTLYIQNLLKEADASLEFSQLARGLPSGVGVEYLDSNTIEGAFTGRKSLTT